MIYEIRMTVTFCFGGKSKESRVYIAPEPERRFKTTLIEYIPANGVAEAFNKAAERKHEILIDLAKAESELWSRKAWGPQSNDISISLDAVVAKPELEKKMMGWYYVDPKGNVTLRKIWIEVKKHITIPKNKLNDPDIHCPSPV